MTVLREDGTAVTVVRAPGTARPIAVIEHGEQIAPDGTVAQRQAHCVIRHETSEVVAPRSLLTVFIRLLGRRRKWGEFFAAHPAVKLTRLVRRGVEVTEDVNGQACAAFAATGDRGALDCLLRDTRVMGMSEASAARDSVKPSTRPSAPPDKLRAGADGVYRYAGNGESRRVSRVPPSPPEQPKRQGAWEEEHRDRHRYQYLPDDVRKQFKREDEARDLAQAALEAAHIIDALENPQAPPLVIYRAPPVGHYVLHESSLGRYFAYRRGLVDLLAFKARPALPPAYEAPARKPRKRRRK
jgi:hypothetical protein